MKEGDLERQCVKLAKRTGWIVYKGDGRVGAPDRLFVKLSYVFTVEFKKPGRTGGQSDDQKQEQILLEKGGTSYHLCNNIEAFLNILEMHETRIQSLQRLIKVSSIEEL